MRMKASQGRSIARPRNLALLAAAFGAVAVWSASASATPVTGTFSGTIEGVSSLNFGGVPYAPGDDYTGTFSFDTSNFDSTFTATITDVTSRQSFTFPSGYTASGSASGTAGDYTVSATDDLEFPSTFTPFTATLSLSGAVDPGAFPSAANFIAGVGSLSIDVPAEPITPDNQTGNPEEMLTVDLNVPEPMSLSLLGFGFAGLAAARRRFARR